MRQKHVVWLCGVIVMGAAMASAGLARQAAPAGAAQQGPPVVVPTGRGRTADVELLKRFDLDKNGWLNSTERDAARAFQAETAAAAAAGGRGRGGRRGGRGGVPEEVLPGRRIAPADVTSNAGTPLYDIGTLRTMFLEFEEADWEDELAAFYHTDVELPGTLRVDGRTYDNVGFQFRGNSSFFSVSKGKKRSMSVKLDHVNEDQRLEGYQAMTWLNANADPTFLRSVLYLEVARDYMPALKANYVRVVINGESWGVYVNQQRYNKDFLKEAYKTEDGTRFKSSNRSRGGGLSYLGEDVASYRSWYEIQSKDTDAAWKPLMNVTRVLAETPPDRLKAALEPIFNVDGALRYLALDIVMMSGDGYWLHGSDYNLYVDTKGMLHMLHHDTNEAFSPQGGGRSGGVPNAEADPFVSTDDPLKALRQKLLVVPEFRTRYLEYIRDIARDALDWTKIGPRIDAHRKLIGADIEADTRKLASTEEFTSATFGEGDNPSVTTIKGFIQQRREFLLNHPAIKALEKQGR